MKQERNNLDFPFDSVYTYLENSGRAVSIVGNPNLGNIKTIMLGVRNPIETNSQNGESQSGEIWVNELRLTGFNEKGGWAARTQVRLRLADFANIAFAGSISTVGFGSLEKNISERNLEDSRRYNLTASVELGQLFSPESNVRFPMYVSVSESKDSPQYNPLDPDILLATSLDVAEKEGGQIARDSLERIVQDLSLIHISEPTRPY